MVASRYIGQRDNNLLSQVFYPNLALMIVMLCALPFVFMPMTTADIALVISYAALLFGARWVLVAALSLLPTYVVTPLMNLQFIWMVTLGFVIFGEVPGLEVYLGAFIIIAAGSWLVWDQTRPAEYADRTVAAE
jgi:drug/metabolite transporter (DMT)-like permease